MRNDRTSSKSLIRRGRVAAWGFMMSTTLLALWALGPRPTFVEAWEEPELPDDLDAWLAEREHAAAERSAGGPPQRPGDDNGELPDGGQWVEVRMGEV